MLHYYRRKTYLIVIGASYRRVGNAINTMFPTTPKTKAGQFLSTSFLLITIHIVQLDGKLFQGHNIRIKNPWNTYLFMKNGNFSIWIITRSVIIFTNWFYYTWSVHLHITVVWLFQVQVYYCLYKILSCLPCYLAMFFFSDYSYLFIHA